MGQISIVTGGVEKSVKLSERYALIVLEIGADRIDSASAFVSYLSDSYGFSKSSVWYDLKRLKDLRELDFATKLEPGKQLMLTKAGLQQLHSLAQAGVRLEDFELHARPLFQEDASYARNNPGFQVHPGIVVHAAGS